ncbi:ubiquinol-cytochrome c reductase iron-sulfur subunit [Candidatus Odyssella acanthamoebae]|uniref:Ubiquinol-cytochrome c reductase iron-sulfur subunit n=1 Tax=Candidatus Odyssella acanthamoebae TaxID=91604 RepID=A0A077AU64_9PROT|nr:ubiquinol-cytochrome c reductase iron-sulfur subunit [Candidatus Paracaedibacter acanthamoebae]AIK96732.1 ubiquinol-cytochrome C reductase [Candidatus Paracaedibacter acanthamoebae]
MATNQKTSDDSPQTTRRDFIHISACAFAAVGAGAAIVPFIQSMNPAEDVLASSTVDVDVSKLNPGESLTAMWRGKPIFIKRRTEEEVKAVRAIPLKELKDPQTDQARVEQPDWLVVIGVCTHLGCIPTLRKNLVEGADGWLCACHGSKYDGSGRIISGPAPTNLPVPAYTFLNDNKVIRIGEKA